MSSRPCAAETSCVPISRLLSPRPGPGVCRHCFDLIGPGSDRCRSCQADGGHVDVVLPISYSVGGEFLHDQVSAYKRAADRSVPAARRLIGSILGASLQIHERCLLTAAHIPGFDLVTTLPSGSSFSARDRHHPLHRIVGELPETATRFERLLRPGEIHPAGRRFDPDRYRVTRELCGLNVLLIDDMWTTGASAQSAAAALRTAGAAHVAAVVVARHLNRDWADNDLRLRRLFGNFSWETCGLCAAANKEKAPPP